MNFFEGLYRIEQDKNKELEERIDKAIEYIESKQEDENNYCLYVPDLLNILKGEDK